MATTRPPGPARQAQQPVVVRDGTLARSAAPRPGSTGGDVAAWSLERKLVEAARRTTPKLPAEFRSQFALLFAPQSIAITGAVLVAWAASHAVGIGEGVDVALLLIGLGTVGWQATKVAKDVAAFGRIAASARSTADLDRAADRLAEAVATVGVTVFVALIFRGARALGGVARTAAARQALWGRTVEEWLTLLAKPRAPALVRERMAVALGYLRVHLPNLRPGTVLGYLKGIDFSKDVAEVDLHPGDSLVMYGDPAQPGNFFTKVGTAMDRLGINPSKTFQADREQLGAAAPARDRVFVRYVVRQKIRALESRTAEIADSWSDQNARTSLRMPDGSTRSVPRKYQAGGGGRQYILDGPQLIRDKILVPASDAPPTGSR